jgi:hypothetical protein
MDWKSFTKDIVLFNELVDRFVDLGCTEKKAFELATYVYAYNLPVVIKTTIIPGDDKYNKRYNTDK